VSKLLRSDGSVIHYDHDLDKVYGQDYAKVIEWAENTINLSALRSPEYVVIARTLLQLHDLLPVIKQNVELAERYVGRPDSDETVSNHLTTVLTKLKPFFEEG
jgi:hypothetical protein